jgi:hypothetical protein
MNSVSTTIYERLRAFWKECDARPRRGSDPSEIASAEHRLGRSLPGAVSTYFRTVNGTEEIDPESFEAWPLERVTSVLEEAEGHSADPNYRVWVRELRDVEDYVVFGDWLISSAVFAVRTGRVDTDTQVVWICGGAHEVVAPTFEAFWELYLTDPKKALLAP